VIRIHSRVPVADPGRITEELVAALRPRCAGVWLGVHCNHARELTADARTALARLANAGLPLMAQTVLLKGVNDDVETLEQLMRALVAARVKPYYLHHPDLVRGTSHFRVSIADGQALMKSPARPALGSRTADLCARCTGRPRQGPGGTVLSRRRSGRAHRPGCVRRQPSLSAALTPWNEASSPSFSRSPPTGDRQPRGPAGSTGPGEQPAPRPAIPRTPWSSDD
jgi:L-lysine 2,3-aminomutase